MEIPYDLRQSKNDKKIGKKNESIKEYTGTDSPYRAQSENTNKVNDGFS